MVLGICIFYYFLYNDIKDKNQNISMLENGLSSQVNKQQLTNSMQSILKNSDADIAKVNSSMVASDGDVAFIENLESIAQNNNLKVGIESLVFQDDPSLGSSTLTFFNVRGKIIGGWTGTYLFLSQLESLPFKIKINRFAFTNSSDTGSVDGKKTGTTGNSWESVFEISVLKYK